MNINNYSYIQCKTLTCYILSFKLYSYVSYCDIHYNTIINNINGGRKKTPKQLIIDVKKINKSPNKLFLSSIYANQQ